MGRVETRGVVVFDVWVRGIDDKEEEEGRRGRIDRLETRVKMFSNFG